MHLRFALLFTLPLRLLLLFQVICQQAVTMLAPGGYIVLEVCSVLEHQGRCLDRMLRPDGSTYLTAVHLSKQSTAEAVLGCACKQANTCLLYTSRRG